MSVMLGHMNACMSVMLERMNACMSVMLEHMNGCMRSCGFVHAYVCGMAYQAAKLTAGN
jgi:hypothetical protein